MSIEQEWRTVVEDANTAAGDRIYPLNAPDRTTYPYVVYALINSEPVEAGASPAEELNESVLDVACHAETFGAAKALAQQVRTAVIGAFEAAIIEDTRDERDSDTRRPASVSTYRIWHRGVFP